MIPLKAARRTTAKRWVTPAILGTVGLAVVAMVVAAMSDYHEHALKSEFSEALVAANDAMTHVEDYYKRHDVFPSSNAEAGYTSTSDWKAIHSVSIGSGGVVTATFSAAVPEFSSKSAIYTPAIGADRGIR